MEENFQQGIAALKAGDRAAARRLLGAVVRQSPDHIQAWLWLSGAVDKEEERVFCLKQVLRIHPNHPAATRALAQILERQEQARPHPQPAPPIAQQVEQPSVTPSEPEPAPSSSVEVHPLPEPAIEIKKEEADPEPVSVPSSPGPAAHHPNFRFMKTIGDDDAGRRIFRSRPSLAPTLIGFWMMFFIAWGMNAILQESTQAELTLSLMNCGILGGVVVYLLVNLMLTNYELTSRQLTLSIRGKRTVIPIPHILDVVLEQNWLQKATRTGDLIIEASIEGELRRVRMRNLTDMQTKKEQILYLVREQM